MPFPVLSMEHSNPGLWGAQRVGDIYQKILQNQQLGVQNRYLPETLGAQLQKLNLENEYYPQLKKADLAKIYQGEIPNLQATAKYHTAGAGKLGAETIGQKLENDFFNSLFGNQQNQNIPLPQTPQGQQPIAPVGYNQENGDLLRKEVEDTILKHPKENPEAYAKLIAQKRQEQQSQTLNTFAQEMQPGTQQMQQAQPLQYAQQTPQETLQDRMLKYADYQAMKRGQELPSMAIKNAIIKEKQMIETKDLAKYSEESASTAKSASDSLTQLRGLETALNNLPKSIANSYMPSILKRMQNNPNLAIAMKNGANLALKNIKGAGIGGRVLKAQMELLANGIPNENMPNEAARELVKQVRLGYEKTIVQNEMVQKLDKYAKNKNEIDSVITMADKNIDVVDDKGGHPSRLDLLKKYATPEAIQAVREGINYIPSDIPMKDLSPYALRELGAQK